MIVLDFCRWHSAYDYIGIRSRTVEHLSFEASVEKIQRSYTDQMNVMK